MIRTACVMTLLAILLTGYDTATATAAIEGL